MNKSNHAKFCINWFSAQPEAKSDMAARTSLCREGSSQIIIIHKIANVFRIITQLFARPPLRTEHSSCHCGCWIQKWLNRTPRAFWASSCSTSAGSWCCPRSPWSPSRTPWTRSWSRSGHSPWIRVCGWGGRRGCSWRRARTPAPSGPRWAGWGWRRRSPSACCPPCPPASCWSRQYCDFSGLDSCRYSPGWETSIREIYQSFLFHLEVGGSFLVFFFLIFPAFFSSFLTYFKMSRDEIIMTTINIATKINPTWETRFRLVIVFIIIILVLGFKFLQLSHVLKFHS